MKTLIVIGGILWLGFFLFHLLFWKLFDWNNDLNNLSPVNKATMQVLNLCLMLVMLLFAYISIIHTEELLTTGIGKSVLVGIVLFGVFRSIEQLIFFDLSHMRSKAVLFVALLGTAIYTIPLVSIIGM